MPRHVTIGLVGDHDDSKAAHLAIPLALRAAGETLDIEVLHEWVPTEQLVEVSRVSGLDGIWCVPGSPYRSMDGVLLAIRHAREKRIPFLGTCGGFQHAIVEYARNVLGWSDAEHGESASGQGRTVISPLTCALLNEEGTVRLVPGTRISSAYRANVATEEYFCSYGVNQEFRSALVAGPLRATATDESDALRAVELDSHPFFVATLFQPERAALKGRVAPLVVAFVAACAA